MLRQSGESPEDWSEADTSQVMLATTPFLEEEKEHVPLEPLEGAQTCSELGAAIGRFSPKKLNRGFWLPAL